LELERAHVNRFQIRDELLDLLLVGAQKLAGQLQERAVKRDVHALLGLRSQPLDLIRDPERLREHVGRDDERQRRGAENRLHCCPSPWWLIFTCTSCSLAPAIRRLSSTCRLASSPCARRSSARYHNPPLTPTTSAAAVAHRN